MRDNYSDSDSSSWLDATQVNSEFLENQSAVSDII